MLAGSLHHNLVVKEHYDCLSGWFCKSASFDYAQDERSKIC